MALSDLPALTKLDLSGNKISSVNDLEPLAKLPKLESLDVFKCPVCPAESSAEEMKKFRASVFGMIKSLRYLNKMDADGGTIVLRRMIICPSCSAYVSHGHAHSFRVWIESRDQWANRRGR